MDKLKIRRYKASDNPIVWELHWLGLSELGIEPIPGPLDHDFNNIEEIYLKNGDFLVGEIDGKVIAMGAFKKINEEVAELKRMRVHPDFQGRGFGQAILEELEKRVRKLGFKRMILDTSKGWFKAQKLYKKNGYIEIGRNNLSARYNAIFYEKQLS